MPRGQLADSCAEPTAGGPTMDMAGAKPQKGVFDEFSKKEQRVLNQQEGVNVDSELRTKVDSRLVTKGLSGSQKWKAALEKIEEDELDRTAEKERIWEGPEAREVSPNTLRKHLALAPDTSWCALV